MSYKEEQGKAEMRGLQRRANELSDWSCIEWCLGTQGLEFHEPECEFWLWHLLDVWTWTNHLMSLSLEVLIHERGILIESTLWIQFWRVDVKRNNCLVWSQRHSKSSMNLVTIIKYNNCSSALPTGVRVGQAEWDFYWKDCCGEDSSLRAFAHIPSSASFFLFLTCSFLDLLGTSLMIPLLQGNLPRFQDSILNVPLVPMPSLQSTIMMGIK